MAYSTPRASVLVASTFSALLSVKFLSDDDWRRIYARVAVRAGGKRGVGCKSPRHQPINPTGMLEIVYACGMIRCMRRGRKSVAC